MLSYVTKLTIPELLHREGAKLRHFSSRVMECHAEAVSYMVLSHFGIEVPYSAEYLMHWGTTPDLLRQELDIVTAAASHMIKSVHALNGGEANVNSVLEAQES